MSDYLSVLIMRSREPAAAITPRLSSRYEGPVVSDTPAVTRTIQEEPDESSAPDEIKSARSVKTISMPRAEFIPADDSLFVEQRHRSKQADTQRTISIRDFDTQQPEKQTPVALPVAPQINKYPFVADDREQNRHTSQESQDLSPARVATNRPAQEQAAQKAADQSMTLTRAREVEAEAVLPSARQQKPPDQTTRDSALTPQPRTQTIEPPETRRPRIEVSPNITAQPRIAAYAEPKASPVQQTEAATEQQPVINITIGRVEVRASMSQSRVRQGSRAQSPVMSLDEYLRQRKEGER